MSSPSLRLYEIRAGWLSGEPLIGRLAVPTKQSSRTGTSQNLRASAAAVVQNGPGLRFQYDDAWIDDGVSLGSDLPLERGVMHPRLGKSSFGFLEDRAIGPAVYPTFFDPASPVKGLPEDAGKLEVSALLLPHKTDALSALSIVPADSDPLSERPRVKSQSELPELIYAFHAMERGKAAAGEITLIQNGLTLPGRRPVFTVERHREMQTLRLRSMLDPIDRPLWMHMALAAAERCGIRTVEHELVHEMGENVLFTRRSDRASSAPGEPAVKPQLTLTGASLARRNDSAPRPLPAGYLALADILNGGSAAPKEDLPQMWRRITFQLLTGGAGDSLARWQFRREPLGWRLSPAYSLEWNPSAQGPGLTMDGRKRLMCADDALPYARYFGLSVSDAKGILMEMRRVLSGWEGLAEEFGADARDIAYMAPLFEENL